MGSLAATAVYREVAEILRTGGRPVISRIALKHGYAKSSANSLAPTYTKTYKDLQAQDTEMTLAKMALLRNEALKEARRKTKKARFGELVNSADTMTKAIQLLTGGLTQTGDYRPLLALQINLTDVEKQQKDPKNSGNQQIPQKDSP